MSRLSGQRSTPLVCLSAEYAKGTLGASTTSGSWQTRPLNTKSVDTAAICTLASNEFTLPAGSYEIIAAVTMFAATYAALRLYNVTDAAMVLQSPNQYVYQSASNSGEVGIRGRFSITAAKTFRLETQVGNSSTWGQGLANDFVGTGEIYAQVLIRKVA